MLPRKRLVRLGKFQGIDIIAKTGEKKTKSRSGYYYDLLLAEKDKIYPVATGFSTIAQLQETALEIIRGGLKSVMAE